MYASPKRGIFHRDDPGRFFAVVGYSHGHESIRRAIFVQLAQSLHDELGARVSTREHTRIPSPKDTSDAENHLMAGKAL
jgi:hypothetical protein